jgi:hypothetical protein
MIGRMAGCGELAVGMVEGEDMDYYHGCGAIGSTEFRTYLNSPREYWFKYVSGEDGGSDGNVSQQFGKIAHAVILENKRFVFPKGAIDRRTKAGKEEYGALEGNNRDAKILDHGDGIALERMIKYGLGNNGAARELLMGCEHRETTYRVKHGKEYLQCRPDGICNDYIIDLKTCRSISSFLGEFWRYGYHIQAAWYNHVLGLLGYPSRDFEYIAVEKEGGYECVVFEYPKEESEKVWDTICEPVFREMMKSLERGKYVSRYKNVETIITPDRCFAY